MICSEYNKVPNQLKDDNVIPSVSEIPSLLTSIRHPRKSRSVSIGPQSEADAYETLAYRAQLRRESKSDITRANPGIDEKRSIQQDTPDYFGISTSSTSGRHPTAGLLPTPASSNLDLSKSMTENETAIYTPLTPSSSRGSRQPSAERRQDEKEEKEMFSKLEKPRVRYDVEVITKLIVYTGTVTTSDNNITTWTNSRLRYCLDSCRGRTNPLRNHWPWVTRKAALTPYLIMFQESYHTKSVQTESIESHLLIY